MITTLLVADRGEMAARIMRTCRRLGIRTVGVVSSKEKHAVHAQMADDMVPIDDTPLNVYQDVSRLCTLAHSVGAQAVHPGYGFLAERYVAAQEVLCSGLIWVGPHPDAIRKMAHKAAAKAIAHQAGVPILPGVQGTWSQAHHLVDEAKSLGFPLVIKPVDGGGGRGIQMVQSWDDWHAYALDATGDVILERGLPNAQHVEVQLARDTMGSATHLFERVCSVQRRCQKLLEEAPAVGIPPNVLHRMRHDALALAEAVDYHNLGTVEWLYDPDDKQHYFLEMNTRIQVEHPVTEAITGYDLVAWQLHIASGESLPQVLAWDAMPDKHAIEVRVCAEVPSQGYCPAAGTVTHVAWPCDAHGVRVDAGVKHGTTVLPDFDPLVAKVVGWGNTRQDALCVLHRALCQTDIDGVSTNLSFLRRLLSHPDMQACHPNVSWLSHHHEALCHPQAPPQCVWVALSMWHAGAMVSQDPSQDGWGQSRDLVLSGQLAHNGVVHTYRLVRQPHGWQWWWDDVSHKEMWLALWHAPGHVVLQGGHERYHIQVITDAKGHYRLRYEGSYWEAEAVEKPLPPENAPTENGSQVKAPFTGQVVRCHVRAGDEVTQGSSLVALEAMKMVHPVVAPAAGHVRSVAVAVGQIVHQGEQLVSLDISHP